MKILVTNEDHPSWAGSQRITYPKGTVLREAPSYVSYRPREDEVELSAAMFMMLQYSHMENARSSTILWFSVEEWESASPLEEQMLWNREINIRMVPIRSAEFDKMLLRHTIREGVFYGWFVFNKKGPSISLSMADD